MNGSALIETRAMTRVLPGPVPVTLVRDIDVTVGAGEFIAVTGPSGSGKSSLLYLLGLLDRPTEGTVWLKGIDTETLTEDGRSGVRLARIGFVFQFHFLLPEFTIIENVLIPMRRLGGCPEGEMRERAAAILDDLDLAENLERRPHQLSGGQLQRAAVARALANDPPILLADEPTGNLDTKNADRVTDIFQDLAHSGERAVVMVTHNPDLAARADRRIHVVDGRVAEDL
ncbi:MAG: ABC transporter ATP-binding protein [Rhodospirillales bacterium]|nr:ABC transporter ATP-binding protein [Alphaproteobacteria bacterium]MBL6948636.1 ABC transporter ATP-binding protein [Rhodospirillales bacterium]